MSRALWERYKQRFRHFDSIGLSIDTSRMGYPDGFVDELRPRFAAAFEAMAALERGEIANLDEKRMVGHYWLRAPELAPTPVLRKDIEDTVARVRRFAQAVHSGEIHAEKWGPFMHLLVVGIGGSALGPQLVAAALGGARDRLHPHFVDNTDPDGIDRALRRLDGNLDETLTIIISKSGGTKETRNGMLEVAAAYRAAGLDFARHAVAVTGAGSELDQHAERGGWVARFPMWDWVGGRTSETSAVGLLPAALQGIDVAALLEGARACDVVTRTDVVERNPAALLALSWYWATKGRGEKDMVILPYKDRLELFSRYLQQLVMESIGKEKDKTGKVVHQGIAVYGNKGSTDQHAYVQQLRDGVPNFFATFIEVLRDRETGSMFVETAADGAPGAATAGDYLSGFLLGTRQALHDNGRESVTLTIERVDAAAVGTLIALYERAVGLYAEVVGINAYHQPGVEAGKKAAGRVLEVQARVLAHLESHRNEPPQTAEQIARALKLEEEVETIFKILEHAAANPDHGVRRRPGADPFSATYTR
jgi:glucose-6-phosphate isomerase